MGVQARATLTRRAADSGLLGAPHGSCSRGARCCARLTIPVDARENLL